jgi:hypothetical protein
MKAPRHYCSFTAKQGSDREHRFYWRVVKLDPHFAANPLFTDNNENTEASDSGHRNRANYADHISQPPIFRPLDEALLRQRVSRISQIEFSVPPIPKRNDFPDIENVQIVAYQRIVTFRRFLDEILGNSSRFWKVHRNPSWVGSLINFQLTEQRNLRAPSS